MLGGSGLAQTPLTRDVAAVSSVEPSSAAWETAIAAGETRVMSVYHVVGGGDVRIGYAIAELQAGIWNWTQEGIINETQPGFSLLGDPSVAYDSISGDFLVCAMSPVGAAITPKSIVVARYDIDANPAQFDPWQTLTTPTAFTDKPWIVAGEVFSFAPAPGFAGPIREIKLREFYIAWEVAGTLNYLRSMDGGQTWVGGPGLFDVEDPGSHVLVGKWVTPRVHNKRPIYLAHLLNSRTFELVCGDDIDLGAHAGEVQFTRLLSDESGNPPLAIVRNRAVNPPSVEGYVDRLPGGSTVLGRTVGVGMDLAVDPTDAGKLYVVYHDTATNVTGDNDVNIYLRVLNRVSGAIWSVGDPIQVNNDNTQFESDQFTPAIEVDATGKIHVIFYDDRNYNELSDQLDGTATTQPRYDVWYAWAAGSQLNFQDPGHNLELCDDPPSCANTKPAIDYGDFGAGSGDFLLRDYIGIDAGNDRIWTSFMGSSLLDTNPKKSVIWSSQILPQ